jgi:hypothetical protein
MASRNFCDLCDRLIRSDEPQYSIILDVVQAIPAINGWNGTRINICTSGEDSQWVDVTSHNYMVCTKCITVVKRIAVELARPTQRRLEWNSDTT